MEQEDLPGRAREIEAIFRERLGRLAQKHEAIGEIRGRGAMIAIELFEDGDLARPAAALTSQIVARAREKGLILLSCGTYYNVLRVLVPLTVEDELLERGLAILGECFDELT